MFDWCIDKWEAEDDEHFFTAILPPKINRINCICGHSLVAHYAYGPQRENGLEESHDVIAGTDIVPSQTLNRFRELAGIPVEG